MTAPPPPSCIGFPNAREVSLSKLKILLGRYCQPQITINCAIRRICPIPRQEISSHTEDTPLYLLVALCYIILVITAFLAIVFDSPFLPCTSA
jgi:hypothetical protein